LVQAKKGKDLDRMAQIEWFRLKGKDIGWFYTEWYVSDGKSVWFR
jgi:hypothetical protein